MKKFVAALMMLATLVPAVAAEKIQFNPGGSLGEHYMNYTKARNAESKFEVDGICFSACTLITGLIPDKDVCATEFGLMGFHSAFVSTPMGNLHSPEGTKLLWNIYPERIRELLKSKGWDGADGSEHPDLILIPAMEIYKECPVNG